jgi:hypothetical protein
MKEIIWTIPVSILSHSEGTNIIIEKSMEVKHLNTSYSLFVVYFESENDRYWRSEPITYTASKRLATMYRNVIESNIHIMETCLTYNI